jgi:cytochrome P450
MLPQFHGRQMESYGGMMAEVARRAVARWPTDRPFELWPRMQAITLEAVMRVVFGPEQTASTRRLRELLRELTDRMNAPRRLTLLALLGPRSMVGDPEFRAAMELVEEVVLEEVRKRRAEGVDPEREDIVSMLAHAHYEDGSPMTARDLRDELITLLLDGPTSTSLAWVFERLLRHPDKLARLREEVRRGEEDAYLDAVVKETLRLCPPVPIVVRRLLEPMELGGYTVAAGAMVAPCIHLVHRREDVYPHPRRFMPERWLGRPAGTYTWIPFGGGVRRCLAASFALLEMKRVVAAVLEEVEMEAVQARSEQVTKSAISYSPGRRGLVRITRRLTAAATPATPSGLGRETAAAA